MTSQIRCTCYLLTYATPHIAALAEGARADRVQAGCSGIQMHTPDSSAVRCWRTPSVICWWGSSASPLCIDIIACCPTHLSYNHRRSSFSGRCARLWNTLPLNVTSASSMSVFRKHLKTHLFSHSFP